MADVTDEVADAATEVADADLTVNIDTVTPNIPPGILALGQGVHALHDDTKLRVQHVELTQDDHPPHFRIEGLVLHDH